MTNKSLIIVSGGMDSVTLLHQYRSKIAMAVSFDYGQKHSKELQFAKLNCDKFGIDHRIINIAPIVLSNFKSHLLQGGQDIPEGHYEDSIMKQTVVPFRNGIMLSIATGIAESNNISEVLIANHAGDHAIYPDCRKKFIRSMQKAIAHGTYAKIILSSPYVNITKRHIAFIGRDRNVDYNLTWSCYKGGQLHCGKCGTCVERKEALQGFDPTEYEQ